MQRQDLHIRVHTDVHQQSPFRSLKTKKDVITSNRKWSQQQTFAFDLKTFRFLSPSSPPLSRTAKPHSPIGENKLDKDLLCALSFLFDDK
jgi:hypothetical protein